MKISIVLKLGQLPSCILMVCLKLKYAELKVLQHFPLNSVKSEKPAVARKLMIKESSQVGSVAERRYSKKEEATRTTKKPIFVQELAHMLYKS